MTPFALRRRINLPAAPTGIAYDGARQVATIGGAPIDGALMKSWGENGDVASAAEAPASLAETWGNR